jgi:hypothetical protein
VLGTVTKQAAGVYNIAFNRSVQHCSKVATLEAVTPGPAGLATIKGGSSSNPTVLTVITTDLSGNAVDRAFYLTVNC